MRQIYLNAILLLCVAALTNLLFGVDISTSIWCLLTITLFANICTDLYIGFIRYRINLAFLFFKLFYLVLILLEPFISILTTGEFSYIKQFGYHPEHAIDVVIMFHVIYVFLLIFFDRTVILSRVYKEPITSIHNVIVLLVFNIIGLYPYVRNGLDGFVTLILGGRSVGNSQFGNVGMGNGDLLIHLSTLLIAVSCIAGYKLLSMKQRGRLTIVYAIIFVLNLVIVASSGTRTRVVFILLPLAIFYFYTLQVGFRSFSVWRVSVGLFFSLVLFSVMAQFRVTGYQDLSNDDSISLDLSGINLNNEFVYIVENFSRPVNQRGFVKCLIYPIPEQFWKFLVNPIPRIIYKNKYVDPSFAEFNIKRIGYSGQNETFNITPTIFGRFFLLYGYVGLVYIPLFTIVPLYIINRKMTSHSLDTYGVLVFAMMITFLCQSLRDLSPGWIYSTISSIFIIFFFRKHS